jgi:hypothetical protein
VLFTLLAHHLLRSLLDARDRQIVWHMIWHCSSLSQSLCSSNVPDSASYCFGCARLTQLNENPVGGQHMVHTQTWAVLATCRCWNLMWEPAERRAPTVPDCCTCHTDAHAAAVSPKTRSTRPGIDPPPSRFPSHGGRGLCVFGYTASLVVTGPPGK